MGSPYMLSCFFLSSFSKSKCCFAQIMTGKEAWIHKTPGLSLSDALGLQNLLILFFSHFYEGNFGPLTSRTSRRMYGYGRVLCLKKIFIVKIRASASQLGRWIAINIGMDDGWAKVSRHRKSAMLRHY